MRLFVSLLIFLTYVSATTDYYPIINKYIYNSLNQLDIFLSDSNISAHPSYSIRSSIDIARESSQSTLFRFNFKAKIKLPRTMRRFKLFFEDFKQKTSIDTLNGHSIQDSINKNSYLLGLQYHAKLPLRFRLGMKINSFDPFAGIGMQKEQTWHTLFFLYGWDYRYYIHRKEDLSLRANMYKTLNNTYTLGFENSYRFEQKSEVRHQAVDGLHLYHHWSASLQDIWRADVYMNSNKNDNFRLDYYYFGCDIIKSFVKKRYFLQISPALLWRAPRSFHPSYRLMLSFGVNFYKK